MCITLYISVLPSGSGVGHEICIHTTPSSKPTPGRLRQKGLPGKSSSVVTPKYKGKDESVFEYIICFKYVAQNTVSSAFLLSLQYEITVIKKKIK